MRLVKALERNLEYRWNPPIPEDRNGNIIGYEFYIIDQNGWYDVKTVNSTEKVLEELKPYTNYTVQVAAMTSAGVGPYSVSIIERTKEASKYETCTFSLSNK